MQSLPWRKGIGAVKDMRAKLKEARNKAGLTQQATANALGVTLGYYQKIEAGERDGAFKLWDAMEDLFETHQRVLRQKAQEDNR